MTVFEMPTHIIASMMGQVLCMCKDYIATHVLTSCYLPGHKRFGRSQLSGSSFFKFQSPLPYGRCEWIVGYGDLN